MNAMTGMSRAIARQILLQDPRINLTADTITSLKLSKDLGKGKIGSDPLDLMKLLYKPSSMHNYDEFLNTANIRPGMSAKDIATRILAEVELSPNVRYAEGGLAEILQAPRSGMRIGGMGLLTRGLRAALKRTTKGYDKSHADYWDLMDNPSYLLSPVNMQKIKKLEIYRKQLVRDILRNEGRVGKKYNPEMHSLLKIDSNNPKPVATRADLQLLDDYIAQLKNKIKEVGYYGQGAAAEKALVQERNALSNELPFSKFVRDKFLHADGGRIGYSKGRLVKGALAILNRNKKNAEYMFKASDNVSPGYAAGDLKYNAELLADQLAEDAGVVFADLDSISQTKFYGTAYDYLVAEKRSYLEIARKSKEGADSLAKQFGYGKYAPSEIEKRQIGLLEKFDITGRKPNASGGLAKILEV